ncbi:MAG: M57 family metalloprotease [Proteobacteria bacterium]|nr:M57 family metalloprotease [Pseudomonadota bacterium]
MTKATLCACFCALIALTSCAEDQTRHADELEIMSWTEFLEKSTRHFEGATIYVADGDIAVSYNELRQHYDNLVASMEEYNQALRDGVSTRQLPSTVNRVGGSDDLWPSNIRNSLTYCVTNDFQSDKSLVVNGMAQATADLEAHGKFDFIYDSSQDGNCRNTNSSVVFSVRPWNSGGACAFFPSGGGCVPRTIVIDVSDFTSGAVSVTGVLRHELGHVLGLRHEHIRFPGTSCTEGGSWRAVTSYDSSSMMHYPSCPGSTNGGDLVVTSLDGQGIGLLYGSDPGPGPDPNSCQETNSCGKQAPGGCWCDSVCRRYNDCCSDGPC